MNEIAKTNPNLPASVAAMQGLANSVAQIGTGGGGEQYMKMTKFGEFVFGAEQLEVEEDSQWAVNATQFTHGWICWGTKAHGTDGEMLGEVMVAASGPLPDVDTLPAAKGDWTKQVGISLMCMNGSDEGIECVFKTNSLGGKKAYTALVTAVVGEVNEGSEAFCPVVELDSTHYAHKKYGKIFTPDFKVVEWITLDGMTLEDEEEEPEPEPAPKKRSRKKAAKKAAPKVVEEAAEEAPEEEAPPRRRRRRAG